MLASIIYVASSAATSHSDRIPEIKVPTLIVWGKKDKVVKVKNAKDFHQNIEGSQLIIYDEVGHLPMLEAPERSLIDVLTFLKSNPE